MCARSRVSVRHLVAPLSRSTTCNRFRHFLFKKFVFDFELVHERALLTFILFSRSKQHLVGFVQRSINQISRHYKPEEKRQCARQKGEDEQLLDTWHTSPRILSMEFQFIFANAQITVIQNFWNRVSPILEFVLNERRLAVFYLVN